MKVNWKVVLSSWALSVLGIYYYEVHSKWGSQNLGTINLLACHRPCKDEGGVVVFKACNQVYKCTCYNGTKIVLERTDNQMETE